jgi:hypothetical protein
VEKVLALRKGTGPVNSPKGVAPMPVGFNVAPPVNVLPQSQPAVAMPIHAVLPATAPIEPTPPLPNMPKPETAAVPETQAKQETEARMLVSDLLEIGMAQRKAYEEAQRKAAEGKSADPATTAEPPRQP